VTAAAAVVPVLTSRTVWVQQIIVCWPIDSNVRGDGII
jgi:hypothetical protein